MDYALSWAHIKWDDNIFNHYVTYIIRSIVGATMAFRHDGSVFANCTNEWKFLSASYR